jgi:hypothetical protein
MQSAQAAAHAPVPGGMVACIGCNTAPPAAAKGKAKATAPQASNQWPRPALRAPTQHVMYVVHHNVCKVDGHIENGKTTRSNNAQAMPNCVPKAGASAVGVGWYLDALHSKVQSQPPQALQTRAPHTTHYSQQCSSNLVTGRAPATEHAMQTQSAHCSLDGVLNQGGRTPHLVMAACCKAAFR